MNTRVVTVAELQPGDYVPAFGDVVVPLSGVMPDSGPGCIWVAFPTVRLSLPSDGRVTTGAANPDGWTSLDDTLIHVSAALQTYDDPAELRTALGLPDGTEAP